MPAAPPSQPPAAHPGGSAPDFNLRPPADAPAPAPSTVPAPSQPSATGAPADTQAGTITAATLPGEAGLSATSTVVGVAILLLLAAAIFFVRGAIRSHLIAGRASPSAAGNAGWALFGFLLSLSVLIVFGLLGSLWTVAAFVLPLLLLILVTLALFVVLYRAALRGRVARRR